MADLRVPQNIGGYAPHQYIHYNWANYRRNVSRQTHLRSTSIENVYSKWADKAAADFKNKFKVDPEMADFYHQTLKEIYDDPTFLNDSMQKVVSNIDKEIKDASARVRQDRTIEKALDKKTSNADIKKRVKQYTSALEELLNAIASIDQTIMKAQVDGRNKNIGVSKGALTVLGKNNTALSAYVNIQNAVKGLKTAMKEIQKGKSVDVIKFDKYSVMIDEADKMLAAIQKGQGSGAIPIDKFTNSVAASLSYVMGEYMEMAMVDTLKNGLDVLFKELAAGESRTGATKRKFQTDVKALTHDNVEINIGVRPSPKGTKTTFTSTTVGDLLSAWSETGVGNNEIYEYLLLNATAHSFLGHNGFSKEDYQVNKILRLMAAQVANFAIGKNTDYIFFSDSIFSKYEIMKGMSAAQKNFKRLMFTLGGSDINQGAVDQLYRSGIIHRLNYLRPRVLAVQLKIESK